MNQVITTTGVVQATEQATGGTIPLRGSSGEETSTYQIGTTALNYPGIAGGIFLKQASKVADYTAAVGDNLICVNATGANRTISLPAAASSQYMVVKVKRTDATEFTITVDPSASETIDGQTTVHVNAQYECAEFYCDGSNWHETSRSTPQIPTAKSASFSAYGAAVFNITTGAGTITVTLPAAAPMKGQSLTFKKVDSGGGSVTFTTNSTETIDGTNDPTGYLSGSGQQYKAVKFTSDGSNWHTTGDVD
jgi:hypothetical protein